MTGMAGMSVVNSGGDFCANDGGGRVQRGADSSETLLRGLAGELCNTLSNTL